MCEVGVGLHLGGGKIYSAVTTNSRFRLISAGPHSQLFIFQSYQSLFLVVPGLTGLSHVAVATWPSLRNFSLKLTLSWFVPRPWP